jgi:subtilisin family serine protease
VPPPHPFTLPDPIVVRIDTGIDPGQVVSLQIVSGVNLGGEAAEHDTMDRHGHGTKVAATLAQRAPQALILPIKLTGDRGYIRQPGQLETAFNWVIANRDPHGPRCGGLHIDVPRRLRSNRRGLEAVLRRQRPYAPLAPIWAMAVSVRSYPVVSRRSPRVLSDMTDEEVTLVA